MTTAAQSPGISWNWSKPAIYATWKLLKKQIIVDDNKVWHVILKCGTVLRIEIDIPSWDPVVSNNQYIITHAYDTLMDTYMLTPTHINKTDITIDENHFWNITYDSTNMYSTVFAPDQKLAREICKKLRDCDMLYPECGAVITPALTMWMPTADSWIETLPPTDYEGE